MKKRNFITGFSAAFVATLALISCGGIRAKDGVVLTINGHPYTALDLFGDQKSAASAEAKFNAVYKVAIRRYFESGQPGNGMMSEVTRETKLKIEGAKEEARNNASKNGTKYDVEWKKILSSNGVDSESGLYDKFEYDVMKTKFEDKFYENNYDVLRAGGFLHEKLGEELTKGVKLEKGYLQNKFPYHMKHILVNIKAADKDNVGGTITADESIKIYRVINALAKGKTFEEVSEMYNDDGTAKDSMGSLGIMSKDTNFVNDFKLGTYMYEAFYGTSTQASSGKLYKKTSAEVGLGLKDDEGNLTKAGKWAEKIKAIQDPTTKSSIGNIGQIPYGVVRQLADDVLEPGVGLAKVDFDNSKISDAFDVYGIKKADVKEKYYPRNVLFNKYFNKHNIMVITPTDGPDFSKAYVSNYVTKTVEGSIRNTTKDTYDISNKTGTYTKTNYPGFYVSPKNEDSLKTGLITQTPNNVLRDNNGRVILAFRSGTSSSKSSNADTYQGIHFVVIERSPFIDTETDFVENTEEYKTTLEDYYTEYFPTKDNNKHPTYDNKTGKYAGKDKHTFSNYFMNDPLEVNKKNRANTVKTELKKADDNLNTYIYKYLEAKGELKFSTGKLGQSIQQSITDWIDYTKRGASEHDSKKKWNETWETYYNSLAAQNEQREETPSGTTVISRLTPEICINAFQGIRLDTAEDGLTLKNLFGAGGVFHD